MIVLEYDILCVVAAYNVGVYLPRFFESLKNQTYKGWKIVFVYDDSPDDTLAVARDCQKEFLPGQIEILRSPIKNGLGAARDYALDNCNIPSTVKYLSYLDPDDTISPGYFEKLRSAAEKKGADITFCGFSRVNQDTNNIISFDMIHNANDEPIWRKRNDVSYWNPSVWNKLYRFEKIKNLRFGDLKRSEDVPYLIKTLLATETVYFINEPLYQYYVRADSLAMTFESKHLSPICESLNVLLEGKVLSPEERDHISGILFLRICIGANLRIYEYNKKNSKGAIAISQKFMNESLPAWWKSKVFSFRTSFKLGKKAYAVRVVEKMFRIGAMPLFLKTYEAVKRIKKTETRW